MPLDLIYFCGAMPDDATESVATHSSIGCNRQSFACPSLMFGCSGTQIYDPEVRDKGSGQLWDNDRASWSSVLPQSRTRATRAKDKSPTARPPLSLLMCLVLHQSIWCDMSHFCATFSDWKPIYLKSMLHSMVYQFCIRFVIKAVSRKMECMKTI